MTSHLERADRWARAFLPRPAARLRLFCLPYAGAPAACFRRWMSLFPADIEVRPVEYPGRGTRQGEPFSDSIDDLAGNLAEALPPLLDRPFAVLGYSMGALVAFELVRALGRAGSCLPGLFLPCARRAPHISASGPGLSTLPDSELLAASQHRYGAIPGAPLDPELQARALPVLRADLRALEAYRFLGAAPLSVPIVVCAGATDTTASGQDLAAWQQHSSATCQVQTFPGGHFFLATEGEALCQAVVRSMASYLRP